MRTNRSSQERGSRRAWVALALFAAAGCRSATPAPPPPQAESVKPGINERFLSDDLDVDNYVGIFEGESREIAVEHAAIAKTLELQPGMDVADIGAGTGLFLEDLAGAVGDTGKLYAVDISPGFIEHLRERTSAAGLSNVELVLCTERSAELAPRSVDVAFVCDTYHHFEYPAETLYSLFRAVRPNGRLVVVDFERIPGVTSDWLMEHVRADKQTFRAEIEASGFVFEDEIEVEGLAENYVLRFRRPR